MSYEIPQSLQYKEKIIFNLTLEQLIFAAIFGLPTLLIYAKTSFSLHVRIALMLVPALLGICFMFFDLWTKISDLKSYFEFRHAKMSDKRMKKYLELDAVEYSCYHLKSKKLEKRVALLKVEPLNFKIKTNDEKSSIILSFQKFLNSLDFPIQFLMYTDDLNLNQYLKELELKAKNADVLKAHKNYLDKLMQDKLAVNRKFLIAVQENETGLESQLKIITEFLQSMNLKTTRLAGRQLISVLIKLFNNQKGRAELLKHEKSLYNIISPEEITCKPDYIKINEYYNRIICAVGYPRSVEEGFLDKIITATGNFDLSIHVEPFPIETTLLMLNKEVQKQRADLFAAEIKHQFQPSLEIQYKDTTAVLNSIQKGQEKLFNVSLYINIKAKDLKELNILTKTIQSRLNSILIIPKLPKFRQAQAFKSILPFAQNKLGIKRNITTQALSAFFPSPALS